MLVVWEGGAGVRGEGVRMQIFVSLGLSGKKDNLTKFRYRVQVFRGVVPLFVGI